MKLPRVSDEEIVFLKNLGFRGKEMAKMLHLNTCYLYQRLRPLKQAERIAVAGWESVGENASAYFFRWREEKYNTLCQLLKKKGVIPMSEVQSVFATTSVVSRVLITHADDLQVLHLKWGGGGGSRGGILRGSRFIKLGFLGKHFLALRKERTALVRFLMSAFRRDREYGKYDVKAITQWLKRFHLSRAERVAITTSLGYKYVSNSYLTGMRIDGFFDQPSRKRLTTRVGDEF